jgi:hypothetical protein
MKKVNPPLVSRLLWLALYPFTTSSPSSGLEEEWLAFEFFCTVWGELATPVGAVAFESFVD